MIYIISQIFQLTLQYMIGQILNGLVLGSIFVLIALGVSIIFGLMGIVNFAHGSFLLVGAYIALTTVQLTGYFLAGVVVATIAVTFLGYLVERLTLRPIYNRNILLQVLLTFGLAEIIREGVQIIWGRTAQPFPVPSWGGGQISFMSFAFPSYRVFVICAVTVLLILVYVFLTRTDIGLVIRAASADREMVNALGIDVTRMFVIVFALGSALAGIAGALIGPIRGVNPQLGIEIILPAFVVVVIGGLGSLRGSVLSGLLIGQIVVLTGVFLPSVSMIAIYVFMAIVLVLRPRGLFGRDVEVI